jgi:hypothetical protein
VPTVPLYSSQPIQEAPIRAPSGNQIDTRALGFDANAFKAATDLGDTVSRIADEAKQRADQVVVLGADSDLAAFETQLLHDPKTGALNQTGENALGQPEQVKEKWDQKVQEIGGTLSNDSQRFALMRAAQARYADIDKNIQAHVSAQVKSIDNNTIDAYIKNEQTAATTAADPKVFDADRIATSLDRQTAAYQDYAKRNGVPQEVVTEKLNELQSNTHKLVVEKLLANDADIKAKAYYDENKDTISANDQITLDKAVEEGSLRGESQRAADQIIKTASDQVDAIEQARKIADPKRRDETERRLVNYYSEIKAAKAQARDDLYLQAANIVDQNPGKSARESVPAPIYAQLELNQKEALDARSSNMPNDNKKWLDFLDLNSDQLGNLNRADFEMKYWVSFDKSHRERAENQWNAAQEAKLKGIQDPKLTQTLTFKDRIDETLRTNGLIPANKEKSSFSKDQATSYALFEQAASAALEHYELNDLGGKRRATGQEMQKIIDDLAMKKVKINSWFSDPEKPAVVVKGDEEAKAYVPIEKIPQADQNQLNNLIRNKQKKTSTDKLQRAYAAYLIGDRKLFDSILGE